MNYLQSLLLMEGGWKPNVEVSLNCPRCGSSNTKFCYYNNYSLTQPRYFCKGCLRYWTKGGSLRNIPVGGGCRKNRRGKSIRLSTTDIMSSRSPGFRGQPNHLLGLSHGSSSSTGPPNIDLALVYANFLNPQPPGSNTVSGCEPQEEPNSSDTNNGQSMDTSISSTGLLEAAGNGFLGWESLSDPFADTHLNRDGNDPNNPTPIFDHPTLDDSLQAVLHGKAIQQCGSEGLKFHGLAPLPGEDAACPESLASWSGLHHLLVDDHDRSLQAPELPVPMPMPELRQGEAEDPNLLIGTGYREFDFPEGEDVFPRK